MDPNRTLSVQQSQPSQVFNQSKLNKADIRFLDFFALLICIYVYVHACMCTYIWVPTEAGRWHQIPLGAEVTAGYEPGWVPGTKFR